MSTEGPARQSDAVYEQLRNDIIEWRLVPGEALSELELTQRFEVSRTPLREALHRLAREGLVSMQLGRGATVAELSMTEVVELVQWRQAVEPYAVRLCARRSGRTRFDALEAELSRLEASTRAPQLQGTYDGYFELIGRFDDAVGEECGNRYLAASLLELRGHLYRIRRMAGRSRPRMQETIGEHLEICRAIAAGDELAAVQAAAVHIERSFAAVLDSMQAALLVGDAVEELARAIPEPVGSSRG